MFNYNNIIITYFVFLIIKYNKNYSFKFMKKNLLIEFDCSFHFKIMSRNLLAKNFSNLPSISYQFLITENVALLDTYYLSTILHAVDVSKLHMQKTSVAYFCSGGS